MQYPAQPQACSLCQSEGRAGTCRSGSPSLYVPTLFGDAFKWGLLTAEQIEGYLRYQDGSVDMSVIKWRLDYILDPQRNINGPIIIRGGP
jgi:hypothetical protein